MVFDEQMNQRGLSTLVDVLNWRGNEQADKKGYTFLLDGDTKEEHITYGELDKKARMIAVKFQELGKPGDRVLILFPPGLDFISAYFGCLYAGMIAIPLYPHLRPKKDKMLDRIVGVAKNAQPSAILVNSVVNSFTSSLFQLAPQLQQYTWFNTDELVEDMADQWKRPDIHPGDLAFLQYTSGSTGTPKGVMVSHGNLVHNTKTIFGFCGNEDPAKIRGVSWLPPYHDMGLIGSILTPLYGGFHVALMPPVYFLQRPYRWLKAISRLKATTSPSPNFGFDYCVKKVKPEQMEDLDLSSWVSAFNGAEPIHAETLENFYNRFKSVGFKKSSFVPSFGMAETTLMITGSSIEKEPLMKYFDANQLEVHKVEPSTAEANNAKKLVASGEILDDIPVKIVDPYTKNTCNPNQIGEIWVQGPSVANGYWNRPEESEEIFNAYTSDTQEGPFLRTGDLGFIHDGELFVTGRIKDLIIIDGSNHYPQDIERSAEASHEAIVTYGAAAFSVRERNSEKLIVMVELDRRKMRTLENSTEKDITKAIRAQVSHDHDLRVYDVYYVPKRLPKTTSGKVQRHMCRKIYLESKNEILT